MGDQYPDLVARRDLIASVTQQEEVRFRETIDRGLKILDEEFARSADKVLPGKVVFTLEATYGFPMDLTRVIADERGFSIDEAGYQEESAKHRALSEGSKVGDEAIDDLWREAAKTGPVKFLGYEREEAQGKVVFLVKDKTVATRVEAGDEVAVVVDQTPFYGESGGQVGDKGEIRTKSGARIKVTDTQRPLEGVVVHLGEVVEGSLESGETVVLEVDHSLRTATRRNHSATHLLHWALRKVLGESATQKGSLVGPDRLRFDYSGGRPLTPEEIATIEDLVNEKVLLDAKVETEVLPIAEAKKKGATMIFGDKYGETVRVLTMTKDSVELCGGTHARALGEIGLFKITSETGIAAGVRRIEAATGMNALAYVRQLESAMKNAARLVKAGANDLPEKIEKLLDDAKKLEKELADTKRKLATGGSTGGGMDAWVASARTLPWGKVLAVKLDVADAAVLREIAEKLRDKLGDAVVVVGSATGDKAMLVCTVSKSLVDRFKAGDLIRPIAEIVGGKGGGRPDMAQAGGTDVAKIDEALEKLYSLVS
jgi:alanyl-tRNA synthetase